MTDDAPPIAQATENGAIESAELQVADSRFLVRAAGFVPSVVEGGWSGDCELSMAVAFRLSVTVLSDLGAPIVDARVTLQPRAYGEGMPPDAEGSGDPMYPAPCWVRDTDAFGKAEFFDLPDSELLVRAHHEHYCVADGRAVAEKVAVKSRTEIAIVMQDMYGVVIELPTDVEIQSEFWKANLSTLDRSYGVLSSLGYCRQQLGDRFARGRVYCHRPSRIDEPTRVQYTAMLRDGSLFRADWPLTPVRLIQSPVFAELDTETRARVLRFEARLGDGSTIDTELVIGPRNHDPRETPRIQRVTTSEPMFVEHGDFRVFLRKEIAWIEEQPTWDLLVDDANPAGDLVTLNLRSDVIPVRFRIVWPEGLAPNPVHMRVRDKRGHSKMLANQMPTRGEFQDLMPVGDYEFVIPAGVYEAAVHRFTIDRTDRDRLFEIPLQLAKAK
ncbi:MAG: hypothetical protein AB7I19_09110 [Planctomycetota bacterium]